VQKGHGDSLKYALVDCLVTKVTGIS